MADLAVDLMTMIDTPLGHVEPVSLERLSLSNLPMVGKVTLRGNADDPAFAKAAQSVLGVALPTEPMTSVTSGGLRIFWKAFDEWLIWTPEHGEETLIADLRSALKDVHKSVVDISDYYTIIRISGPLSRVLLAKGCVIDLHPRSFKPGQATGTGFHHATIFITLDGDDTFDVMIRWSFADYLWHYLVEGAQEWA